MHGAQDTGGHEGVPVGLAVGEIDLVDGGDVAAASGELHTPTSLHSHKQQGDVALKMNVASVCFNYFKCFRGMLQLFYTNVVKVDRTLHMLQWLYTFIVKVYSQCFICVFGRML